MIELTSQPDNTESHSRSLRVGRWSESHVCYAITKCVESRRAVLATDSSFEVIRSSLDFLRQSDRIRLIAFCVMPDHLHLLFFPLGMHSLSDAMKSFSRFTARHLNDRQGRTGTFWQEGFHDRRCRNDKDVSELLAYIEYNPVRAGMVANESEWPFSSANPRWKSILDRDWYSLVR